MDGSSHQDSRDRPFDPSRIPLSDNARRFVELFIAHLSTLEKRSRARKEGDQVLHVRMSTALALDLAHRELSGQGRWLAIPLQRAQYGTKTRAAPFLTEKFPEVVRTLASDSTFVDFALGAPALLGPGTRSVVRAGSGLRELIDSCEMSLSDIGRDVALCGDTLVLRSRKVAGKARKLAFAETAETQRLREEMGEINGWLANADLAWLGDEGEDGIDCGDRFLRRIFNDGSLDRGGRLFGGFWQRATSEARLNETLFEGHPASALDFGQMAVRIAYSIQHAPLPEAGDLYEVPGFEHCRDGVKRVLNALLAADSIPLRFPQGSRKWFPRHVRFAEVRDAIERRHPLLKPLFGTGQALRIMKIESDLLVAILLRLKGRDVVALPIHDCVLVSQKDETTTKSVMENTCLDVLGVEGEVAITRSTTTAYTPTAYTSVAPSAPPKKGA